MWKAVDLDIGIVEYCDNADGTRSIRYSKDDWWSFLMAANILNMEIGAFLNSSIDFHIKQTLHA